jgi:hypothetical protein
VVFAQTSPPNVITTRLTLDEYRAMEETNPERHEHRNGEIISNFSIITARMEAMTLG